jgi:hypothetical protein
MAGAVEAAIEVWLINSLRCGMRAAYSALAAVIGRA